MPNAVVEHFNEESANPYVILADRVESSVSLEIYKGTDDHWEKNPPLFIGHIKWDGCSNWKFQEGYCLHFCGVEECMQFGKLLHRCYEIALQLMPENAE